MRLRDGAVAESFGMPAATQVFRTAYSCDSGLKRCPPSCGTAAVGLNRMEHSKGRCAGPALWTRTISYDFVRKPLPPFSEFVEGQRLPLGRSKGRTRACFIFYLIALNNFSSFKQTNSRTGERRDPLKD